MTDTDFGFEQIPENEKVKRVGEVFHSVASRYDIMNDLMSLGLHRLWKRFAITCLSPQKGQRVLDLAGGTGDLTALISPKVGPDGTVILSDINSSMLNIGRERLLDKGLFANVRCVLADAEQLPFPANYFDCEIIGFGLRNITDKNAALRSLFRCLKPGGKAVVLEFSKPSSDLLNKVYDLYSFKVLPKLGAWVAKDSDSYRYLAESIRKHPNQNTLKSMMQNAGFEDCQYYNLCGGIVAVHTGYKY